MATVAGTERRFEPDLKTVVAGWRSKLERIRIEVGDELRELGVGEIPATVERRRAFKRVEHVAEPEHASKARGPSRLVLHARQPVDELDELIALVDPLSEGDEIGEKC